MIFDKDLGHIKLVKNVRAKRITVRFRDDQYHLTYPPFVSLSFIEKTVAEMKLRLLKLKSKKPVRHIFCPQTQFEAFSFIVRIIENTATSSQYVQLKEGVLSISFSLGTDFDNPDLQSEIRRVVEHALRIEAKRLFPNKVKLLAKENGFTFTDVKINKSRSRWGSCSSTKSINLSYYCMLLPEYLIDFVVLHELCHTIEMNHGERFWQLLDKVSGGKAKELTRELRDFKTQF